MRAGFQELCGKDSRFEPYAATLFGQAAAELDRDAKSPEANRKLDASIAAFLALLAEYFLLPAAMQALEFLVRRLRCRQLQPRPDCACICMGPVCKQCAHAAGAILRRCRRLQNSLSAGLHMGRVTIAALKQWQMLVVSSQAVHPGAIKGTSAGLPSPNSPAVVQGALEGRVHLREFPQLKTAQVTKNTCRHRRPASVVTAACTSTTRRH